MHSAAHFCPAERDGDILELYALGHLPPTEEKRLEIHLLFCQRCQDALTTADEFISEMKSALTSDFKPALKNAQAVRHRGWVPSAERQPLKRLQ